MDEAERLCDRVAIIDLGRLIALDTPRGLIATLGGEHVIEFTCECQGGGPLAGVDGLAALPEVSSVRADDQRICLSVREPHVALPALLARLEAIGCTLTGLSTRHASLEDVFVKLAGRHLIDEEKQ
jgi:ABC-2 type transport system ATP-binding protein